MIDCDVSDGAKTSGLIITTHIDNNVQLSSGSLHNPPPHSLQYQQLGHQLVSANSFEMTSGASLGGGGTSLSEDSGLPYTNSSVSSGDSIRCMEQFKLETELTESDGEVSQFDSLDCSDGGMSAENFNTLKKGPLALIEPPPQFQVRHTIYNSSLIKTCTFTYVILMIFIYIQFRIRLKQQCFDRQFCNRLHSDFRAH